MPVIQAKSAGFCYGVRRAVELDTGALTFEESLQLLLETIRRRAKL